MLVVDDEALVRHALRTFLDHDDRVLFVGEAADGAEALDACVTTSPDVVLMDIRMPTVGGVEATRRIVDAGLPCRVLALTTITTEWRALETLRAGACGYLLKDSRPEEIIDAVVAASAGDLVVSRDVQTAYVKEAIANGGEILFESAHDPELSSRELQIVRLIADGLSNLEIASRLSYSEATVKADINRINRAWGVRNRLQIVLRASAAGIVAV